MQRELALRLYATMVQIHLAEESFVQPILDGEIKCPVHLYTGQEAIAAGLITHLTHDDYIFGSHRSHGHYLAKGGSLRGLVAEVYCRETGCSRGRGGSMHLISTEVGMMGAAPIVAGTISLALGAALATRVRGCGRVSVAFFGDGATGEGVLYEAMNFAAIQKLPLIFACENNLYSTHMPIREIRVDQPIADLGKPFGLPSFRVDGNDVRAVYDASAEAVAHCRAGNGPVLMEFLTYRMRGHVGPNDNIQGTQTDIRPAAEVAAWKALEPIHRFEEWMRAEGLVSQDELDSVRRSVAADVEEAHSFARASAWPDPVELERYVFQS